MINLKSYVPANCKVIAHYQPWHGSPGHVSFQYPLNGTLVHYDETNSAIVADQVSKMKGWGIDAINVDYYEPSNVPLQQATDAMFKACTDGGLGFSICIDANGINTGVNATQAYIAALGFVAGKYATSPTYLLDASGKPFVNFFGEPAGVDWNAVRAALPIPMTLLFEGSAYSHTQCDGCYGWVNPTNPPQNINTASVQAFNSAAAANPTKAAWFPAYPGFDDSVASWSANRCMVRGSGRTLRDILALVPTTAKYVLVSTWNDHEEASALEEGVSVTNP